MIHMKQSRWDATRTSPKIVLGEGNTISCNNETENESDHSLTSIAEVNKRANLYLHSSACFTMWHLRTAKIIPSAYKYIAAS